MRLHLKYFSLASATILCLVSPLLPTDSTLNSHAFAKQLYKLPHRIAAPRRTRLRDDDRLPENRKAQADRLFQEGVQRLQRGELQTALTTFQQVLAIRRELDDKAGEGQSLLKLAEVYEKLGQNEQAQEYYRQAEAAGARRGETIAQAAVAERTPLRDDSQANTTPGATRGAQNPPSSNNQPTRSSATAVTQTPQRNQHPVVITGNNLVITDRAGVAVPTSLRDDNPPLGTGGNITLSQTALRDDAQTPLRDDTGSGNGGSVTLSTALGDDAQTPLRNDNSSMGNGGSITLSTTLRDDAQTPLRDDNGSTGGTAAVSATVQRDDDSRRGISIVAAQQTPLRDDNPNRAATRSRQMGSDRNNQPSPAAAVAQTPQRDDDVPIATGGSAAVAQTPQRDDDRHRVTAQQTPLRDDDDNRIATRSTQTAIERKTQADRLFQEGVQQLQRNQLPTALVTFQQVLAIRRELGDKTGEGQAFYQLGKVSEQMGQNQQAQDYYRQARERGIK